MCSATNGSAGEVETLDPVVESINIQALASMNQRLQRELDFRSQMHLDELALMSRERGFQRMCDTVNEEQSREIQTANEAIRNYEKYPTCRPAFDEAGVPKLAAALFAELLAPLEELIGDGLLDSPLPKFPDDPLTAESGYIDNP